MTSWPRSFIASKLAKLILHEASFTITTPNGSTVTVYVNIFAQLPVHTSIADAIQRALKAATISASVAPAKGGTDVTIHVLVPQAGVNTFVTRSVVTTLPNAAGSVLAKTRAKSGTVETLSFHLDVA